jgi:hypothetical protein
MGILERLSSQAGDGSGKSNLVAWNDTHAGHALEGLIKAARSDTRLSKELHAIGERYLDGATGVIRKAARTLVKTTPQA